MPVWKSFFLNGLEALLRFFRLLAKPFGGVPLRAIYLSKLRSRKGKVPASTQFDGPVRLIGSGHLTLGEYCRLGSGVQFETEGEGEIIIGNYVRINAGCMIAAHKKVSIGDDTLIGEYVSIRDANHGMEQGLPMRMQPHDSAAIVIGRDVWIGRGSCILKGVAVGDGAVIGANSVVTKNVIKNSIVAGAPGIEISRRGNVA
jgi:acetyltransferase-like isoleucine patch superfamily enzyme